MVDQVAKYFARAKLVEGQPVIVFPQVLHLTRVHNVGAAFGIFPGGQPVFMFTSLLVLLGIAAYWRRAKPRQWPVVIALAMITAGAFGNLIDRAILGQVTDFFEFGFIDFPVFNVADIGIVVGVSILAGWILFGPIEGGSADAGLDGRRGATEQDAALEGALADNGSQAGPSPTVGATPGDAS